MTPQEFTSALKQAVIEENISIYRKIFSTTLIENASDPYWKSALTLFAALSSDQREVFISIVRQVAIDTTSNVLGVLDGVNTVEGIDVELELVCGNVHKIKLNGDLQDLFLEEVERAP